MTVDVEYGDRVAYLPGPELLVIADCHVGRDASSNVALPLGERGDLLRRLTAALDRFAPGTVVVAGDFLHAFATVPDGVRETVAAFEARVADAGAGLVVTPGNHDTALERVSDADRRPVVREDGVAICHGHEVPDERAALTVVGHEHPVIEIEGRRRPCFLYGDGVRGGADVLVLPTFSRLPAGTPIGSLTGTDGHSPLVARPGRFRPLVYAGGELLEFPRLEAFRSML